MGETRKIRQILKSSPTVEGAGVHLRRVFGFQEVPLLDPFLLLDDFRSDRPEHYLKGFPWHPHRGIETITYMLDGRVEHGDSMGNRGVISGGEVQWMTAGSGIIHQEMPKGDSRGVMGGFQLWANLPASKKMMSPRYQEIKQEEIPEVLTERGIRILVVCGEVGDRQGPVKDIVTDPEYLDVRIPPETKFTHQTKREHTVLAYVIEGKGCFSESGDLMSPGDQAAEDSEREPGETAENGTLILFTEGDQIEVSTALEPLRFLLISGRPIGEPVAWRGPIVMNTQDELRIAFEEYHNGTFIK